MLDSREQFQKQPEKWHHVRNELELWYYESRDTGMIAFVKSKLVITTWRIASIIYEVLSSFQTEHDVWI